MAKIEYIVSACLAGLPCRYDGTSRPCAEVIELCRAGRALPVCPESLGGLPVPREPAEERNGKVMTRYGKDVTEAFECGARAALAQAAGQCGKAILKAKSPSCGFGKVYDGSFGGRLCNGNGIFAQKLLDAGFELFDEENLPPDICCGHAEKDTQ